MLDLKTSTALRENRGSAILAPAVHLSARTLIDRYMRKALREDSRPTDGIFYVIRKPKGWELYAYRYDEFPSIDHSELWAEYVAPVLSYGWGLARRVTPARLEKALALHTYAFPRGRVSKNGMRGFTIHWGGDFTKLGVSQATVERAFTLTGVAKWERDHHERCQEDDREAVRDLLKIKETWPAVALSYFG